MAIVRTLLALLFVTVPAAAAVPLLDATEDPLAPLVAPASNEAWAREVVANLPRATAVNDGDGDKVWDSLEERFLAAGRLGVVVTFRSDVPTERGLAAAQRAVPSLEPYATFRIVPGFAATVTVDQALALGGLDEVRQVEFDHPATKELETATAFFGADHVVAATGIDGDRDGQPRNFTTDDVVVAILDTGFAGEHADLDEGKIVHFHDFATAPKDQPYDDDGHGSHVAGIAAGVGDADPRYRGVAPGAAIVGIKLIGGTDTLADTIKAYEWLVENNETFSIDVATISFGFGVASDGTSALELAVDKAWEAGIVCFKSNGNSGPGRSTMTIPAAARGILGVGSMLDAAAPPSPAVDASLAKSLGTAGFVLSGYSSRGPTADGRIKPDLVAPGQSITSVDATTKDGYVAFSGTSMAAPFAAGTAALVLDANPDLTPDDVRQVLTATAEDWGLQGPDIDYGHGRLRVDRAVEEALRRRGVDVAIDGPVIPFHETRAGTLPGAGPGAGVAERTLEVNDTTHPFALTVIAEGPMLQVQVMDPSGGMVVSVPGTSRQQTVGFAATTTGTYTVRLVGAPGAAWVLDASHGLAGGVAVPSFVGGLLEAAPAPTVTGTERAASLGGLALVAPVAAAAILGLRRKRA